MSVSRQGFSHKLDNQKMNERRSIEVIKKGRPKKLACSSAMIKNDRPKKLAHFQDQAMIPQTAYTKKSSQKYYHS